MSKKRVIVSVTNDLYTDQRVHKICTYLHDVGFNVLLVGRKLPASKTLNNRVYQTRRMSLLFKKGALFYAAFNIRLFFFLLFHRSDILLSNDLDTLLANYLACGLKKGNKLVYDSHELFTEVPELTSRPRIRNVWLRIEKWIFPKLKDVYTVNESIANIYETRYNIPVGVIRNVAEQWHPEKLLSKQDLSIPEDRKVIILQGAGINVDRGAEEAVEAMKWVKNAVLFIVGGGDVVDQLKTLVKELEIGEKVRFVDRVPYARLMNYTYHSDLGLTLDKDTNPNYKYSLPNKLFDYIHAGTPVLSSNIIEIARVINDHDVGVIIEKHDPVIIAKTINDLFSQEERLNELKSNCQKAAKEENWQREREKLAPYFIG